MTTSVRRLLGVAALVSSAFGLGACLDLGNGPEPNCSDEKIAHLEDELAWVETELADNDEAENPIHESILIEKQRVLEAALDACDADEPSLLTGGSG